MFLRDPQTIFTLCHSLSSARRLSLNLAPIKIKFSWFSFFCFIFILETETERGLPVCFYFLFRRSAESKQQQFSKANDDPHHLFITRCTETSISLYKNLWLKPFLRFSACCARSVAFVKRPAQNSPPRKSRFETRLKNILRRWRQEKREGWRERAASFEDRKEAPFGARDGQCKWFQYDLQCVKKKLTELIARNVSRNLSKLIWI